MKPKHLVLTFGSLFTAVASALAQPVITAQPQDQTNYVGTTATFTVVATGPQPVTYQWQKHSAGFVDLTGRTSAVLTLANVQTNDAADYRVVVTDVTGTTNSATAHLSVALPETLLISQPAPGLVTLSWQGSMVLVQSGLQTGPWSGYFNVPAWVRSLDCPVWVRVADTSPVTLPTGPDAQFFRLMALPPADELEVATMEDCQSGDFKACEDLVAAYFLNAPIGTLRLSLQMELAARYGIESGSPCLSAAQLQVLIVVRRRVEGP